MEKGELTKVIPQDRIPHAYMARHTFVETPIGKHPKGRGEMLLAIQAFLLERRERRIRADLEFLATHRRAQGADRAVFLGRSVVHIERWCHFLYIGLVVSKIWYLRIIVRRARDKIGV